LIESMHFLGVVRSERLITDFAMAIASNPPSLRLPMAARVLSREPAGTREVVDITTTAGTFIANGFVVHNCGASGIELTRALAAVGVRRHAVSIVNAIACPLPDYKMARLTADLRKANKRRQTLGDAPLLHPLDCCRPRLLDDLRLAGTKNVVTLGGTALEALGDRSSVMDVRGGPREIAVPSGVGNEGSFARYHVLPTVHPSFVLHARRWQGALRADLSRAFRWFTSGLAWQDPEILYQPTAAQLRAWLETAGGVVIYDVETLPGFPDVDHYDPLFDRLRYLGLATLDGKRAVGIPFLLVGSNAYAYDTRGGPPLVEVIQDFFTNSRWTKAGWNSGYYDRMVIEHHFGVTPAPSVDGIGLHKMVEPELPHRLGYVGSIHTDAPSWKDEFDAKAIKTQGDMRIYNARDCAITALTLKPLSDAVRARGQEAAAKFWPTVQGFCVELHRNGMYVDQARRKEWDRRLLVDARRYLKTVQELLARSHFNPNSVPQIRDLLFDEWALLPHGKPTEAGDPSTGDDTLRAMLGPSYRLDEHKKSVIKAVRRFRAVTKMRGTYVLKLRPIGERMSDDDLAFDEEESDEERKKRIEKLESTHGLVLPDGRIHPDYSAHGTVGWRLSSSRVNAQNFPDDLRDMVTAPAGYVLVGCDEAQLELRMVAALAKAEVYLAALNAGEDPHAVLCEDFFGDIYRMAGKAEKKALRRFVKEFTYASFYLAEDDTKHGVLTSSEGWVCGQCSLALDNYVARCEKHPSAIHERRILYPDLTLREVVAFSAKWLNRNPEIATWWETEQAEFRRQGFLAEPIFGMRRDFLDGEDPNAEVNLKAQSGGSALVHLATEIIMRELPKYGARLVQQGHDSLVVEVPVDHARYTGKDAEFGYCPPKCKCRANHVARMMELAMAMDGRAWGLPVKFVGEAKIGFRWNEV
jgi:uracil-DNA glycosylase